MGRDSDRVSKKRSRRHDSDSDDTNGDKDDRKKHKSKSSRKNKTKKKEHSDDDDSLSEDNEELIKKRQGRPRISLEDYFERSTEFIVWLKEAKNVYLTDISSKESRRYFKKFIKKWNRGKLSKSFYTGINVSDISATTRSSHQWKFKGMSEEDRYKLESVKDSVGSLTSSADGLKNPHRLSTHQSTASTAGRGRPDIAGAQSSGANTVPVGKRKDMEDMDDEDRLRYEKALDKQDRKRYQKTADATMEELVPKATGRDAMIEKKKQQSSYHKQERELDAEYNDRDLLGGDDSFAAALARERKRKDRFEEKKRQSTTVNEERLSQYKAKEDATMAMLRELASKHHGK